MRNRGVDQFFDLCHTLELLASDVCDRLFVCVSVITNKALKNTVITPNSIEFDEFQNL